MSRGHEVAILVEDLSVAQAISTTIRAAGVIPHFYEDLKSFWYGTIENPPSILFVDVMLMSLGELSLCDHPLVRDRSMELVFYYNSQSAPLLNSTFELSCLGLLSGDLNLQGQIKTVLDRFNRQASWQKNSRELLTSNASLVAQLTEIQSEQLKKNQQINSRELLHDICLSFESQNKGKSFFEQCEYVFSKTALIERYALVELAPGEQRAVTHKGADKKIVDFTQLWLGKKCENGIELFAQNLITQVAMEHFSSELIILAIHSFRGNPDKMLFIEPKSNTMADFDWDFLEHYLSGIYSKTLLSGMRDGLQAKREIDSWTMMEVIDREFFNLGNEQGQLKLVDLDFSSLLSAVRARPDIRFYWDRFIDEFKVRINLALDFDFQLSTFGPKHMAISCNGAQSNWFEQIRFFVDGFPFWRFFENAQFIGDKDITPIVRMVPTSSEAYLNYLEHREVVYTRHALNNEIDTSKAIIPPRVHQWSEARISL